MTCVFTSRCVACFLWNAKTKSARRMTRCKGQTDLERQKSLIVPKIWPRHKLVKRESGFSNAPCFVSIKRYRRHRRQDHKDYEQSLLPLRDSRKMNCTCGSKHASRNAAGDFRARSLVRFSTIPVLLLV